VCGVNGIFAYHVAANAPRETEVLATSDAMRARGPDGSGVWWSADRRSTLGHRRLSILDLSDRAAQPLLSADDNIVVTFNGEIYNYKALPISGGSASSNPHTTCATSCCAMPNWAGMAHGVEIRVPLVDVRLLERLALALPGHAPGTGKAALAKALSVPLPTEIICRAKTGFGVLTGALTKRVQSRSSREEINPPRKRGSYREIGQGPCSMRSERILTCSTRKG